MTRFMTGLLLGVGIGLLVAPEKGEDTRQTLADQADKWRDQFNRLVGRAGARMDDLKTLLEKEIPGVSDDVKARIRTILDDEAMIGNAGGANGGSRYEFRDEFKPI